MFKVLILTILITFAAGIDLEKYQQIKSEAQYRVLDYETVQEIFGSESTNSFNTFTDKFLPSEDKLEISINNEEDVSYSLPSEFDWRTLKPECFTPIKNQGKCKTHTVFSTTSALESRYCILSKSKVKPELSVQDFLTCDQRSERCNNEGRLRDAWGYLSNTGICEENCKPFKSEDGKVVPTCIPKCDSPLVKYMKFRSKPGTEKTLSSFQFIKEDIFKNGPVTAIVEAYEDIKTYAGGIYVHTTGNPGLVQSMVIVGWGLDETHNKEYWILRNSWGAKWGENGYIKMYFGTYKVGSEVWSVLPFI